MERRHEQEQTRMTQEGAYTFQEVFSMTSLAITVMLLPWWVSAGIHLQHMDVTLVVTEQQGETSLITVGVTDPEELCAPGLSSSPTHSIETLLPAIPLLPDLPFEGNPSMEYQFFESLAEKEEPFS